MPRTEAGKRWMQTPAAQVVTGMADAIDAIEAEAAADANVRLSAAHQAGIEVGRNEERARIRREVEGRRYYPERGIGQRGWNAALDAVLRIIDGEDDRG